MATVFLAHDLKHDRPVAIKVLLPELATAVGPDRFLREIRLAARLQHPHILTVFDSGEAAGQLWFTMPFVEGESLRERLTREKQLSLEDAVRIAREAALALEYAHQHGVLHRDIKPENLMLTTDGSILIADFGVARTLGRDPQRLTATGASIGTPGYMSPEQGSGTSDLDGRTDVYSLGCVLYEMLAGEPPFSGPTSLAIRVRAQTANPTPIRSIRAAVPGALERVVVKAMAREVADRFASAADLARALEAVSPRRPPFPTPAPRSRVPAPVPVPNSATVPNSARRTGRSLVVGLLVAVLVGGGSVFAWWLSQAGDGAAAPTLLAVLPFDNLGDPKDGYLVNGISDEVRGKLAALRGLQVTARGSSAQYQNTTKSPQQIGEELGVQYLLTGDVRWEKGPNDAGRLQVRPKLIQVSPETPKWEATFDAVFSDVWQVHADIADRVARALNLAPTEDVGPQLAPKPTRSLAAYDAFLRGEAASKAMSGSDVPSLRQAAAAYEKAVALDSTFGQAWAQLARARAKLYRNGKPAPARAEAARLAAERASALAPNRAESHLAWATYYELVDPDNRRAFAANSTAVALAPGNAEPLGDLAVAELALGRWGAAKAHLEQATQLDPRSGDVAGRLGLLLLYTRKYPAARRAYDRALAAAPTNLEYRQRRAMVAIAHGDLAWARTVLQGAPRDLDPTALAVYTATHYDLMWVMDEAQQQRLLRLRPAAFKDDRAEWGIVLAQTYALRRDPAGARAYADSARVALEEQLLAAPDNARLHAFLGLAFAYLGRGADAIREGERAVALVPLNQDAYAAPYYQHQLGRIYTLLGDGEKAVNQLELLLQIPYYLSSGWLGIDPNFNPLRTNPRFLRLVGAEP